MHILANSNRFPTSPTQLAGSVDRHTARMERRRLQTQSESTAKSTRNPSRFGQKSSMGPNEYGNQHTISIACAANTQTSREQCWFGHKKYEITAWVTPVRLPEDIFTQREPKRTRSGKRARQYRYRHFERCHEKRIPAWLRRKLSQWPAWLNGCDSFDSLDSYSNCGHAAATTQSGGRDEETPWLINCSRNAQFSPRTATVYQLDSIRFRTIFQRESRGHRLPGTAPTDYSDEQCHAAGYQPDGSARTQRLDHSVRPRESTRLQSQPGTTASAASATAGNSIRWIVFATG